MRLYVPGGDEQDLRADSRVPFVLSVELRDQNLATASYAGQVRQTGNQGSGVPPLATFAFSPPTVATETWTNADGSSQTGPVTRFKASIDEGVMEGLTVNPADPNAEAVFRYDIHQTFDTLKTLFVRGKFIVQAGGTQ